MDKKLNQTDRNPNFKDDKSQVRDTEGAVMPDADRKSRRPQQKDAESAFQQKNNLNK